MVLQEAAKRAELLTTEEVAALLKVSPATLVDWRHDLKGPRWYKMAREVRYKLEDLLEWERQALVPVESKAL